MINYDYLIIGAGMAGISLAHYLKGDVILLDKNPFSYKIGESHIPNVTHADFEILGLSPKLRTLKSFSTKKGTVFADSKKNMYDNMIFTELKDLFAFHANRSELETFLAHELGVIPQQEEVTDIDLENSIVTTNIHTYKIKKYILDCSGPAKIIARHLGMVEYIPNWGNAEATWGYWDILGKDFNEKNVSEYTLLNHIDDGVWLWQIPLYNGTLLSSGIISLDTSITEDQYKEYVLKYKHPFYKDISPHTQKEHLNIVHSRRGFSQKAQKSAGKNYILVGDAYSFTDPVFSIGTGTAISEAIYVGNCLNKDSFDADAYQKKCDLVSETFLKSFTLWYNDGWKNKFNMSMIQENTLRGNILKEKFHNYQSTLSSYIGLVTGMEDIFVGHHHDLGDLKDTIVYFGTEWYQEGENLEIGYFGLQGNDTLTVQEPEIIQCFLNLQDQICDIPTIHTMVKASLTKDLQIVFYTYLNELVKRKIIPSYKKN